MTKIYPDSPCEVRITSGLNGGVHISVFVPTYSGGQTFRMSTERDTDGDWRIELPAWPEEVEHSTVDMGGEDNTIDVCNGIAYLGAPDEETERL